MYIYIYTYCYIVCIYKLSLYIYIISYILYIIYIMWAILKDSVIKTAVQLQVARYAEEVQPRTLLVV